MKQVQYRKNHYDNFVVPRKPKPVAVGRNHNPLASAANLIQQLTLEFNLADSKRRLPHVPRSYIGTRAAKGADKHRCETEHSSRRSSVTGSTSTWQKAAAREKPATTGKPSKPPQARGRDSSPPRKSKGWQPSEFPLQTPSFGLPEDPELEPTGPGKPRKRRPSWERARDSDALKQAIADQSEAEAEGEQQPSLKYSPAKPLTRLDELRAAEAMIVSLNQPDSESADHSGAESMDSADKPHARARPRRHSWELDREQFIQEQKEAAARLEEAHAVMYGDSSESEDECVVRRKGVEKSGRGLSIRKPRQRPRPPAIKLQQLSPRARNRFRRDGRLRSPVGAPSTDRGPRPLLRVLQFSKGPKSHRLPAMSSLIAPREQDKSPERYDPRADQAFSLPLHRLLDKSKASHSKTTDLSAEEASRSVWPTQVVQPAPTKPRTALKERPCNLHLVMPAFSESHDRPDEVDGIWYNPEPLLPCRPPKAPAARSRTKKARTAGDSTEGPSSGQQSTAQDSQRTATHGSQESQETRWFNEDRSDPSEHSGYSDDDSSDSSESSAPEPPPKRCGLEAMQAEMYENLKKTFIQVGELQRDVQDSRSIMEASNNIASGIMDHEEEEADLDAFGEKLSKRTMPNLLLRHTAKRQSIEHLEVPSKSVAAESPPKSDEPMLHVASLSFEESRDSPSSQQSHSSVSFSFPSRTNHRRTSCPEVSSDARRALLLHGPSSPNTTKRGRRRSKRSSCPDVSLNVRNSLSPVRTKSPRVKVSPRLSPTPRSVVVLSLIHI
eukprot:TRINITY_DN50742_c0_g1_i2.p1 TRINITY_DN50742_c0_g1~~TRINITY_DN50742_c0_g1_i2.p1  ORF type:complete len:780 (+),score=101.16 TRINITY_DN50742_c0_g1_i2:23-2362(+)